MGIMVPSCMENISPLCLILLQPGAEVHKAMRQQGMYPSMPWLSKESLTLHPEHHELELYSFKNAAFLVIHPTGAANDGF